MSQTLNGSQILKEYHPTLDSSDSPKAQVVLSILAMFTCVCGIMGNSLVIWLLTCRMQRTPFCTYILHLAVADLLFLLCTAITICLEDSLLAYEVMQRMKYFAYTVSLGLLTAISTQRSVVCAVLWAVFLLMNMLASFFCSKFWHFKNEQCFIVDSTFSTLIMGVFTPVMTASSVTLFVLVRRSSRQWQRQRQPTRLYVVTLASVLVFLICALPLGISWFLFYWLLLPLELKSLFHHMATFSSAVSSSANPIIYFVVGSRGRRGLLHVPLGAVLHQVLREEPMLEGRKTSSLCGNQVRV
uniref:G-protein coupled receptors family 1 profile domain-containing protein n=1 Tax=Canis lupus familiaris TaxID=9615 RepID=A0A8C0RZT8_CANLF